MACTSTSSIPRSKKESLEDCMCTICLCILIHPVTLPCGHELCMPCFKQTVEEASLSCPLCRTRISTWARKASKAKTLVDQQRWEQIQRLFPAKVQRRLEGLDDETDEEIEEKEEVYVSYRRMVQLSKPGEIREEYEAELKKLADQAEEERRREEEASASLIRRLRSREEQEVEETRRQQEEIAERDAELAKELGKVLNEADTETPVNRLLQESKDNYPNLPLLHPNTSTPTVSARDSSDKGKQPLIKNNNKTLETFFRRLPAGARTAVRCSSEPSPEISEHLRTKCGQGCTSSVSTRPDSVPLTDKENQPEIPPGYFLLDSNNEQFYEDISIGDTYHKHSQRNRETETGEANSKDCVTVRSTDSVVTVHSDQSDSVVLCDELDGPGSSGEEVLHFKPIKSCPKTPPRVVANAVPLEPCVVRITPRVLFSTRSLSTAQFPIVNSEPHGGTSTSEQLATQGTSVMGSFKSKLWGEENPDDLTASSTINGTVSRKGYASRRAKSASPPTVKVPSRTRLASYDESHRSTYARSTLKDFKKRANRCSLIEESVSDDEGICSPRQILGNEGVNSSDRVNYVKLRVVKNASKYKRLGADKHDAGPYSRSEAPLSKVDIDSGINSSGQSVSPSGIKTAGQSICHSGGRSGGLSSLTGPRSCSRPSSPGGIINDDRPLSPYKSADGIRLVSLDLVKNGARSASPEPSASALSAASPLPLSSSRPCGIFNPDTVPPWSEALYVDTVKGKGKRLVKKSQNGIISDRNSPKVSGKTSGKAGSGRKTNHSLASVSDVQQLEQVSRRLLLNGKDCADDQAKESVHSDGVNQEKTPQKTGRRGRVGSGRKRVPSDQDRTVVEPVSDPPRLHGKSSASTQKEAPCSPKEQSLHKTSSDEKTEDNKEDTAGVVTQNGITDDNTNKDSLLQSGAVSDQEDEPDSTLVRRVKRQIVAKTATAQDKEAQPEPAKKPSKASDLGKNSSKSSKKFSKNTGPQRSIKDWFAPNQSKNAVCSTSSTHASKSLVNAGKRKVADRKRVSTSETSDLSSASSSSATSPEKLTARTSNRARKLNPKLDVFLLTSKLQQFKASPSKTDGSSPSSTPTKSQKRKAAETASRNSLAKVRRLTPYSTPEKRKDSDVHSLGEDFSSDDEEGLTQEERDLRMALRLQRQFDLADKFNLNIVRFKGTDDQYSLRQSRKKE